MKPIDIPHQQLLEEIKAIKIAKKKEAENLSTIEERQNRYHLLDTLETELERREKEQTELSYRDAVNLLDILNYEKRIGAEADETDTINLLQEFIFAEDTTKSSRVTIPNIFITNYTYLDYNGGGRSAILEAKNMRNYVEEQTMIVHTKWMNHHGTDAGLERDLRGRFSVLKDMMVKFDMFSKTVGDQMVINQTVINQTVINQTTNDEQTATDEESDKYYITERSKEGVVIVDSRFVKLEELSEKMLEIELELEEIKKILASGHA